MRFFGMIFSAGIFTASSVFAAPISLTCLPDDPNETWRVSVVFDLEAWTLRWGAEAWELVGADERALAARTLNNNWPASIMIDRETGKLWRSDMGRFCTSEDCSSSELIAMIREGHCSKPF